MLFVPAIAAEVDHGLAALRNVSVEEVLLPILIQLAVIIVAARVFAIGLRYLGQAWRSRPDIPLTLSWKPVTLKVMKPSENSTTVPVDILADPEYALRLQATGQRDPAFEQRLVVQTEKIRQQVIAEQGTVNLAVDLIREGRDEE
jgi:hypothetical protein